MKRSRTTAQKRQVLQTNSAVVEEATTDGITVKVEANATLTTAKKRQVLQTNTAVVEEATADGITVKVEANATPDNKPKRCKLKPNDYKISPALEVVAAASMMGPVDPPPTPNIGQVADDENFANHEPPVPLCISTDWTAEFEAAVVAWAEKNGY